MKGLTLIELLVTLAVIAVAAAIGIPQLQNISSSNRLASAVNTLSGDINFARSEAINRNTTVSVRAFDNGVDTRWENGWTVTDDSIDNAPVVIRQAGPLQAGYTLTETNSAALILSYSGEGLKTNNTVLNFQVCLTGSNMRLLEISAVGRVSYTTGGVCP